MIDIPKKIVTDEEGTPIAVQIEYADWKRLEKVLQSPPEAQGEDTPNQDFEQALEASRDTWPAGDGLKYQRRIRSEWDRMDPSSSSDFPSE